MLNMKIILGFLFVALFLFITPANALEAIPEWQTSCINNTHLLKESNTILSGVAYPSNQTVNCPYGCDTARNICRKWPGDALPGEYYMLFQILAFSIFLIMLFRIDVGDNDVQIFDVIIPIFAAILFFSLAIQGINVIDISTGEAVVLVFPIYLDYGIGSLCIVFFFFNLFKFIKGVVTNES